MMRFDIGQFVRLSVPGGGDHLFNGRVGCVLSYRRNGGAWPYCVAVMPEPGEPIIRLKCHDGCMEALHAVTQQEPEGADPKDGEG